MNTGLAESLRAIATAGNAVALSLLVMVLANGRAIFQNFSPPRQVSRAEVGTPIPPLLLVLMDGLRADVAADPAIMPELQQLARRGSRGVAKVEALIPSTVAGLRAMVEGVVIPPGSFVFDFRSRAAPYGGLFEEVRRRSGRSFVAAPVLWRDLYGRWIDEAAVTTQFDGEDQRLLEETLRRVGDPAWSLLVVHFSRPDVAAHLAGGASARYRSAAAWCDQALGQLVRAAPPEMNIVVVSDHGVTDRGGHAGPEPAVLHVPVVAAGPGMTALPPTLRQAEVANLLGAALISSTISATFAAPAENSPPTHHPWLILGLLVHAAAAAACLLATAAEPGRPQRAFWLHAGLWISIATGLLQPILGALCGLLFLLAQARHAPRVSGSVTAGLLVGFGAAAYRLGEAQRTLGSSMGEATFFTAELLGRGLLGLLAGWMLGWAVRRACRRGDGKSVRWAVLAGALAVIVGEVFLHSPGETVSLSTLNVRFAFQVADTSLGLPGAIAVAAVQPCLALLAICTGALLGFGAEIRRCAPAFASGFGAILTAEALVAEALFAFTSATNLPLASLALGFLVRTISEVLLLLPWLAAATWAKEALLPDPATDAAGQSASQAG